MHKHLLTTITIVPLNTDIKTLVKSRIFAKYLHKLDIKFPQVNTKDNKIILVLQERLSSFNINNLIIDHQIHIAAQISEELDSQVSILQTIDKEIIQNKQFTNGILLDIAA